MKKLIPFLFVLLISCEKDNKEQPFVPVCYECQTFVTGIPPQINNFCDRSSMGFTPAGLITEQDVSQYEAQHSQVGLMTTKCYKKP